MVQNVVSIRFSAIAGNAGIAQKSPELLKPVDCVIYVYQ